MATLTANIDATTTQLPADVDPGFYVVGSERIHVGPERWETRDRTTHALTASGRYCDRAIAGTTAAAHASGASLTRYYPDGASEGGGTPTPGPWQDPTTMTPEQHAQWHIDNGTMDPS